MQRLIHDTILNTKSDIYIGVYICMVENSILLAVF